MNKLISMIAICQKSGNLISGEDTCEKTIRANKAKLIIVADDASDNTKKKFLNSSQFYKIPLYFILSKEELGKITGKKYRAVLVVVDEGFSNQIIKLIEQKNN